MLLSSYWRKQSITLAIQTFISFSLGKIVSTFENNSCISNCSSSVPSYEKAKDSLNFLDCSIKSQQCNASSVIPPMKPSLVSSSWYLIRTESNDKVALNFSWSFHYDESIKDIVGFRIRIVNSSNNVMHLKYFCIRSVLDYNKHVKAHFYYDCFGACAGIVQPGWTYNVLIASLPDTNQRDEMQNELSFSISVPDCTDETMKKVEECLLFPSVYSEVEEGYCCNKSIKYSYYISPFAPGSTASVKLCQLDVLDVVLTCIDFDNLPGNSTSWDLKLPANFNCTTKYSVTVTDKIANVSSTQEFSLTDCPKPKTLSTILGFVLIFAFVLILAAVVCLYCSRLQRNKHVSGTELLNTTDTQALSKTLAANCGQMRNKDLPVLHPPIDEVKINTFNLVPPSPLKHIVERKLS